MRRSAPDEAAIVNLEFQRREVLKRLEWTDAPVLAAMPIQADIAGDHPQPGGKAGSAVRLEFKQPAKVVARKSLANVEIAIGGLILIRCAGTSGLVQYRAVQFQEFHPGVARIRRPERFQKRRNRAITHFYSRRGRIQPELMAKFTLG